MFHEKLYWHLILVSGLSFLGSCQRSQNIGLLNRSTTSNHGLVQNQSSLPEYPVIRKNNLESLAIGRNRDEIEKLMGVPDGKSLDGGNGYLWDYRRPVFDESTNKVYTWTLISFKFLKGKCSYITFQLQDLPPELLLKNQHKGFGEPTPHTSNLIE